MKVLQKGFELSKIDYYKTHLKMLSVVFPINLTCKEIEILSHFLSLPQEITDSGIFNTLARKKVSDTLNITLGGMANHIKNIKGKGFLKKEGDRITIISSLLPDKDNQGYNFKLKIKSDNEVKS